MSKKRHKKKKKRKTPLSSGAQGNSYESGLRHFQIDNYRDAIKVWRTVPPGVEVAPKLAEAYFRYGLSFYKGGQILQVLSELHQAVKFNPEKAIYRFHLGLAYHRRGNLEKAITWYKKALEASPENSRFKYHLGLACIEAGAIGEAREHFHSIKGNSEEERTRRRLGLVSSFLKEERWDKALELLGDVEEANGVPYSQSLKGLTLLMMGKGEQAKVALNKAIEAGGGGPLVRYYLGLAYAVDGGWKRDRPPQPGGDLPGPSRYPLRAPRGPNRSIRERSKGFTSWPCNTIRTRILRGPSLSSRKSWPILSLTI